MTEAHHEQPTPPVPPQAPQGHSRGDPVAGAAIATSTDKRRGKVLMGLLIVGSIAGFFASVVLSVSILKNFSLPNIDLGGLFAPTANEQAAATQSTVEDSSDCYVKPKPFSYKPVWQYINRGAHCRVELYYDEPQVDLFFRQKGSLVNLGPYHRGTEIPTDAEQIWSATTFEGEVALPPPHR